MTETDPVVIVTGAASGIGTAIAGAARTEGYQVIGLDVAAAPSVRPFDVTDVTAWVTLAEELASPSSVRGLVNCAGVTWRARLGDVTTEAFRRISDINCLGPLLGIQAISPLMTAGSSIVNVGSLAALQGHYPVAYTTSKWALRGLTHAASLELGARGIRVNIVHPGFIDTPMTASAAAAFRSASIDAAALGRPGTVSEVADVVVFLLSERSSYVTGAEIAVDGGTSSHGGAKPLSDALRPSYSAPS